MLRVLFTSRARAFTAEVSQVLELATGLARRGHAVAWMAPPGAASLGKLVPGVTACTFASHPIRNHPVHLLRHRARLSAAVRAHGARMIFAVESPTHLLAASLGGGLTLVRWRAASTALRRRPLSRWLYERRTARVVVPARVLVERAQQAGFRTDNWEVVGASVDLEKFRPGVDGSAVRRGLGIPEHAQVLVHVGRLAPVKGTGILMEAVSQLVQAGQDLHLVMVGESWEGQDAALRAAVAAHQMELRVHWLGRREDVPAILAAARVGVVSSVGSELHSRAALEYLACGLPVAATRVGVLPEWLEGRPFAALCEPGNSVSLARAIEQALAMVPGESVAAREFAEGHFSPKSWLNRMEVLLMRVGSQA